jgi:ABC-type amino acid transport substrate-binding protein
LVVVPEPDIVKIPLAYPVARGDEHWAHFVNTWIDLKRRDGTLDALYGHWILGEASRQGPTVLVDYAQRAALGGVID